MAAGGKSGGTALYDQAQQEKGQTRYDMAGNLGAVYDEATQSSSTAYDLASGDDDLEL